ncbi:heme exporter protein CcmB, partial [Salmonella enterica]|uniref:heme exporter protein CcmB n=1 Tax=Salmonella enterica TaxID=28901 RepID=UPI00215F5F57
MMWRVFCLELRVAFRHGADIAGPLWFFLMVITLFPLSVGPQPQLLARIAPGIIQVAALLASLLALERLFRDDLQDGSLEQLMLLPVPLPAVVLAKVLAHWAVTGLPLIMLSPWGGSRWGWAGPRPFFQSYAAREGVWGGLRGRGRPVTKVVRDGDGRAC